MKPTQNTRLEMEERTMQKNTPRIFRTPQILRGPRSPRGPRYFRVLSLIGILALVWMWSGLPASLAALAAPTDQFDLEAAQDAYTDLNADANNFDEGLLTTANSPGFPGEDDVTTKQIFLEFDLSGVTFEIQSATLSLATLTCGRQVPVDSVDVAVYGVDNAATWDESTLTWDNQPDLSTGILATLDAGSITANSAQIYTWTDGGTGLLAAWLETQRQANDGSATLVLRIENSENPGLADVFFEDSETSGASYGCQDSLGPPGLLVRDTATEFEIHLPLVIR